MLKKKRKRLTFFEIVRMVIVLALHRYCFCSRRRYHETNQRTRLAKGPANAMSAPCHAAMPAAWATNPGTKKIKGEPTNRRMTPRPSPPYDP